MYSELPSSNLNTVRLREKKPTKCKFEFRVKKTNKMYSFLSSVFKYLVIKVLKRICNMVFGGYIVIFNIKPPLFIRLSIGFINRK